MTFIISFTIRTSIVSSAMLNCSITSLYHVTKSTGATFFLWSKNTWCAPVGAGVALRSAPQLWRKSLERSLMQRASDIFIQSKIVKDKRHFSEIQYGGRIWPFRRVDSVVFVLCIKFGLNICYGHWDRQYDLRLTRINFHFQLLVTWSSLCMASVHLPMKFSADIFIQSGVIDIFPKLKMAAAAILDLFGWPWNHPRSFVRDAYLL